MVRGLGSRVEDENRGAVVTEAGLYLRLIDSYITQLEAQGPSRTCDESKEEEEEEGFGCRVGGVTEAVTVAWPASPGKSVVRFVEELCAR